MRRDPHRNISIFFRAALRLVLCTIAGGILASSQNSAPSSEYDVKAAYLRNFVSFVEWPQNRIGASFNICLLGNDPFRGSLDELVQGESVNGRPVAVRRIGRVENTCQILFVGSTAPAAFPALSAARPGMLLVGEKPSFLREGGMINFVVDSDRVRFDVNLKAAEQSSLKISSRLLAVARTVLR